MSQNKTIKEWAMITLAGNGDAHVLYATEKSSHELSRDCACEPVLMCPDCQARFGCSCEQKARIVIHRRIH